MGTRNKIIGCVVAAAAAAIIFPVLFGGHAVFSDRAGGDSVRNFIYDFQTLITGILAVGAAWWTVVTMQETDASAARRHAEQIDLTLRKDRLAVERAVNPQVLGLRGLHTYLVLMRKEVLSRNTYVGQKVALATWSWSIKEIAKDIIDLLDLEQLREGSRLFDGLLAYKLTWLRLQGEKLANATGNIDAHRFINEENLEAHPEMYRFLDDIYRPLLDITEEIPVIVKLMEDAARKYGVDG